MALSAHAQGRGNAGGGERGKGNPPDAGGRPSINGNRLPGIEKGNRPEKPADLPANDNAPRSAAPAARGLSSAMQEINQTAFAQRQELFASVDMRLKSSRDALKQIQADARASRAEARADFRAALAAVKSTEKGVDDALKAARNARADDWESRRDGLTHAQQAYVSALAQLQATARSVKK